jgi:hypothetical protein
LGEVLVVNPELWYSNKWFEFSTITTSCENIYANIKNKRCLIVPLYTPVVADISKSTDMLPNDGRSPDEFRMIDQKNNEFDLSAVFVVNLRWFLGDVSYHYVIGVKDSDDGRRMVWEQLNEGYLRNFIEYGVPFDERMV